MSSCQRSRSLAFAAFRFVIAGYFRRATPRRLGAAVAVAVVIGPAVLAVDLLASYAGLWR